MLLTKTRAIAAAAATALAPTSFTATPASARHYGNAAAVAVFAGIAGTIAALAARSHYDDGYYAGPVYPYAGPVYAAPRWHRWHPHYRWHR